MREIQKKGQVLSLIIYLIYGVAIGLGIVLDKTKLDSFSIAMEVFWFITLAVMIGIRLSDLRNSMAYKLLYIMSICIFTVAMQLSFTSIFVVFTVFAILWLTTITFMDKRCFHFAVLIQCACVFFLLIIPKAYSGLSDYNIISFIFSLVGFAVADWVGIVIIDMLLTLDEETNEKERSIDDMLEIVETKHQEAKRLTMAKSDFLSNMSHELRTPLNAIIGFNEMILEKSNEAEVLEYSKNIKSAGSMMLSLINDILDLSKIESNKMTIVPVDFDLNITVMDVVNMLEGKIKDKELEFILDIDSTILGYYNGDDVRIKQILVNILNNAVKYTRQGYVKLSVSGVKDDTEGKLHFSVQDSGIGIKKEDLDKLNKKFVRIDEEKNRNIEGTGLGISIVSNFLQLMGSQLVVESEYEVGSNFCFDLVLPVAQKNDDINVGEESVFIAEGMNILVVDDTQLNLKVIEALLEKSKVNVFVANNGKRAIKMASNKKFDLIFLDKMMPDMDGFQTLAQMRSFDNYMNVGTPVVALTADVVTENNKLYYDAGFDDILTKPIDTRKLQLVLKKYWEEKA